MNGSTLKVLSAMSNTVSPGVSSILSLIVSRVSSGYFSRDVLSVEYTFLTYHVPPAGFVVSKICRSISRVSSWDISSISCSWFCSSCWIWF